MQTLLEVKETVPEVNYVEVLRKGRADLANSFQENTLVEFYRPMTTLKRIRPASRKKF